MNPAIFRPFGIDGFPYFPRPRTNNNIASCRRFGDNHGVPRTQRNEECVSFHWLRNHWETHPTIFPKSVEPDDLSNFLQTQFAKIMIFRINLFAFSHPLHCGIHPLTGPPEAKATKGQGILMNRLGSCAQKTAQCTTEHPPIDIIPSKMAISCLLGEKEIRNLHMFTWLTIDRTERCLEMQRCVSPNTLTKNER